MRVLQIAASLAFLASFASTQVVLPGQKTPKRDEKPGDVAPHLVCTVCGERNYNLHDDGRRDDKGLVIGWCSHCKRDTSQRAPDSANASGGVGLTASGRGGRLVLPSATAAAPKAGATPRAAAATTGARTTPVTSQAGFILGELKRLKSSDDSLALRAVDSLLELGPDGVAAARAGLSAEEAPVVVTSARVLLRTGKSEDADLVFRRMREPLPPAAGAPLLELLAKSDPVRASPAFLVEMLEHPHTGVRAVSAKLLGPHMKAELLPLLDAPLASKRADTRRRAIELVARVESPETTGILLAHIADSSSSVAQAAIGALASRNDRNGAAEGPAVEGPVVEGPPASEPAANEIGAKLLGLAFRDRWILRPGACALIGIIEREDRTLVPILDDSHSEALLAGMTSGDAFISGTCAAALAGIGFRSRDTGGTSWLDQEVVDRLVASVSGHEFHNDLPLLAGPAVRRLELLAGQGFGTDGPRWIEWWMHARDGFFARRAWLAARPEDAGRIVVQFTESGNRPQGFSLVGPQGDTVPTGDVPTGERIRIDERQAQDLLAALEREGCLGPERLPGVRGVRGAGERTIEILLGADSGRARGKTFVFGPGETQPWFERTVALARELQDRGRWQRYPDLARHVTAGDLWKEQSAWWAEEHTNLERALRLKTLVLAALPALSGARREQAIAELERLYGITDSGTGSASVAAVPPADRAAEAADFQPLFAALALETYWADTSKRLLRLTLAAAHAATAVGAEATVVPSTVRELPPEQGKLLVDLMVGKLSGAPPEELARIFSDCGPGFATMMAGDARAAVRAAAARALADPPGGAGSDPSAIPAPSQETVATLLRLLGDHDPSVEIAATQALGILKVEAARTELLVRARLGLPDERAAALRAIGRLGGDLVLGALSLALADADPKVRTAAAWGLADLRDPSSATLLIGLLGQGDGTPTTEPARAGLIAMGPGAWTELLRVVHDSAHRARRDAALILARQCVPGAASPMMAILSTDPKDEHVASELAVLTGVDQRGEKDPSGAWWSWWDGVVHDDALLWFMSALSRAGMTIPPKEAFEGAGTREGREFLLAVLVRKEPHLVERARRELGQSLGRDLGPLPPRGPERDRWIEDVRAAVEASTAK